MLYLYVKINFCINRTSTSCQMFTLLYLYIHIRAVVLLVSIDFTDIFLIFRYAESLNIFPYPTLYQTDFVKQNCFVISVHNMILLIKLHEKCNCHCFRSFHFFVKKNDCIETKVKLFPDSSVPCYLHLLKKNAKICFSILSAIYLLPFVSLSCIQSKFYFY